MATASLIYWYEEKTWSVQALTTIVEPKKPYGEIYREGEYVSAKYKGQPYPGVLLRISDNRQELRDLGIRVGQLTGRLSPQEIIEKMDVNAAQEGNNVQVVATSRTVVAEPAAAAQMESSTQVKKTPKSKRPATEKQLEVEALKKQKKEEERRKRSSL